MYHLKLNVVLIWYNLNLRFPNRYAKINISFTIQVQQASTKCTSINKEKQTIGMFVLILNSKVYLDKCCSIQIAFDYDIISIFHSVNISTSNTLLNLVIFHLLISTLCWMFVYVVDILYYYMKTKPYAHDFGFVSNLVKYLVWRFG